MAVHRSDDLANQPGAEPIMAGRAMRAGGESDTLA
jgi:hypothetical protein